MARTKLLITTDNFLPRWDGITRFLVEIVPRLAKKYDITICAPAFNGDTDFNEVRVVRIPLSKKVVGDYPVPKYDYTRIRKLIAEHDIVFNQTLGPIGGAALLAAKRVGKPILSFTHSLEWELVPRAMENRWMKKLAYPFTKIFVRMMLRRATALVVPSEHTADQLIWQGVMVTKRVVHLGVDIDKFASGSKAMARKKLKLPQDAFIIGYHGRIAYEKNLVTLLRAFLRLNIPKKKLLIVAGGVPELKARLQKRNVIMPGVQEDVVPWLRAIDIYVQPSLTETTCLSVLEAMACERPVISSKVGHIQQYIIDGKNGFFFDKRNAYDLAKKIEHVRALPARQRNEVAKWARETVVKQFNWDKAARGINDALREFGPNA